MNQVRIKRDFGEVVIEYSNLEDLENKLEEIEKIEELVTAKVGAPRSVHAQRQPKPGYEDIYQFLPDGLVELLIFPNKNVQRVALVFFAYDQAVDPLLIERCTNIRYVVSKVIKAGGNRKYFVRNKEGKYSLSSDGIEWVTSVVIPKLREKKQTA